MAQEKHKPKAMIWTEAVSASGHIRMSNRLSKALQDKGFDVVIVTSGHAAQMVRGFGDFGNANVVELPSLKPAGSYDPNDPVSFFKSLTPAGKKYEDDKEFQQQRRDLLIRTYDHEKPDIMITEHWPIGRRKYDAEMLPLLDHIADHNKSNPKGKTKLLAYMRDATGEPELGASKEYITSLLDRFDHILTRGDTRFCSLEKTLGESYSTIASRVLGTGYPVDIRKPDLIPNPIDKTRDQVIVSCGGGYQPDAADYFMQVIESKKYSCLHSKTWFLFVNIECSESEFQRIKDRAWQEAGKSIIVERESDSFVKHLQNCCLAIVRGGMTVAEAAAADKPCVVVPRIIYPDNLMHNEQYIRAEAFSDKCKKISLATPEILKAPNQMASLIDHSFSMRFQKNPKFLSNGQYNAAKVICDLQQGVPIPNTLGKEVC